MHGTYQVTVGDRGRIVVPAEVRRRARLSEGDPLILWESAGALVLMKREQLLALARRELHGLDLVNDLMEERRKTAEQEDDL